MTSGENRELALTPPEFPPGIIPALSGGETRSAALVDLRLCASLPIVIIILVAVIVLLPGAWPAVVNLPIPWPFVVCATLSLVGLSGHSYLRIVRFRRR
ncbi:hypothetical protein [Streptomyces lydicus]|uniref:hypothetical protein n=1 Tax=Streptomyces lydicus TaxID=47763 RepID=UPI0034178DE0